MAIHTPEDLSSSPFLAFSDIIILYSTGIYVGDFLKGIK